MSAQTLDSEQSAFLTLINNFRAQNGVGPLKVSATLQTSSQWMSNDMATKNYFSHTDSLGRDPFTRMTAFGYTYSPEGENIAAGNANAQDTLNQWITACDADSTGACTYAHKKNMLYVGYAAIGIGRVYSATSPYGWYWTTDFGGYVDKPLNPVTPNSAPTADSISPNSGSGSAQVFSAVFSDANGYADISTAIVQFASSAGGRQCYVRYLRGNNTLNLLNDAGTGWLPAVTVGSTASVSNTQCTLNGAGSTVRGSGNSLTLALSLTFTPASAGTKTITMTALDKANATSGAHNRGSWTVPGPADRIPTADSASPNSGAATTPQTFRFVFSDPDGAADLLGARVLINSTLTGTKACYLYYAPVGNHLYLQNDAGTGSLAAVTPGVAATVSNSQCSVSGTGSSVTTSGTSLILNVRLSFSTAFAGTKYIYMKATDSAAGDSGWQTRGSIAVP